MNENFAPSRDQRSLIRDGEMADQAPMDSPAVKIDPRAIWSAAYRNRFLIASVIALAIVISIVATLMIRPKFQATASVQIEQTTAKVLESEDSATPLQMGDEDRFLQTQVDIIKSRALAVRVADALGLAQNDNFVLAMGEKPTTKTLGVLDLTASKREQVLGLLIDNMSVDLPRNSRIAGISFTSPTPALAARIANSYADVFITANLQRRYETSAYARGFLENRLRDTRDRLQNSERAAIDYARSAKLIDASNAAAVANASDGATAGPRSLTVSRLVMLSTAYTDAQTQRVAAQQHWEQAKRTPLLNLVEVLSNPAIQGLMQQRAQLAANYQEERQRRKADYPTMLQAAAQIAELDRQIDKLANGVKNTIKAAYVTAAEQERALSGDVSSIQAATLNEQDRSIRYNILRRDVDTNRALYDGLLQRYKEISAEAGIATNNISVIDSADPPAKPVSPRPLLNVLVAIILGSVAAGMIVLAREKFDDAIRTPDDIPVKLGHPALAAIPLLTRDQGSVHDMLQDPRSPIAEAYQALRVSLDLSTPTGLPSSLLFTSSRPSEGKTTTTYAAARDFARLGRKVIVIDGDLRKPSMHHMLGRNNNVGLATLMVGSATIDQAVQTTDQPNLDFIACGPLPPNPAELLASATLPQLLRDLNERYDVVVIDGPPVLGLADSAQLANVVSGTVFVIEAGGAHYGSAKTAIRRLVASHAHILGVVLTKFDAKKSGYGYGYGYNYSYSYAYGGSTGTN